MIRLLNLGPAKHEVQNIQWMFVLHRPKRSVDIKVERQLHDMRILGRIVGVRSTEQFVWHLLTPDLDYTDCSVVSDSAEVSGSLT